jgi:uncharacterized protein YyaL (SSP411 family)
MPENRLSHEKSPYLLQHAHNPVDWYPWGDEAFAAAREADKPIFLSIGYATCHWCHVMERESFEDDEVAGLMNDAFVNIKVDREERPDIDGIYMTVAQLATGQGGWPLTIVMTPDRQPFFAATYIPKESRHGRTGMLDVIPRIGSLWEERREDVVSSAGTMQEALERAAKADQGGVALDAQTLDQGFRDLAGSFDRELGGFGRPPKFPTTHRLLFLLRYWLRGGVEHALTMVEVTLDAMRAGGVYDQVGFGFHRYSTDGRWLLPHFEKMLYDQALLTMAYTEAFQATGAERFAETAREVLTYVLRDMTAPEGGFYSAEDADSEGEEGKFYVWTLDELVDVLGKDRARLAALVWEAQPQGNFLDEATRQRTGANILHRTRTLDDWARELGVPIDELTQELEQARTALLERREGRIRPLLDDKILTDWNGLMIAALAKAGVALGDETYVRAAERAADFVHETLWRDGRLLHRYRDGSAAIDGNVDDYAFLAWGAVELHQATQDPRHLRRAIDLTETMLDRFHDSELGGLFFSPADRDDLIVRQKEVYDGAAPSGNSVAMYNLIRLARLTAEPRYDQIAHEIAQAFSRQVAHHPSAFTFLLSGLALSLGGSEELVLVGDPDDDATRQMLDAARRGFHPGRVMLVRSPDQAGDSLTELAPLLADFRTQDGETTAYLCHDYRCERPVTRVEDLVALMGGEAE